MTLLDKAPTPTPLAHVHAGYRQKGESRKKNLDEVFFGKGQHIDWFVFLQIILFTFYNTTSITKLSFII